VKGLGWWCVVGVVALWGAAAQAQEPAAAQQRARAALLARARVALIPALEPARRQEAEREARLLEAALSQELARRRAAPSPPRVAVAPTPPSPLPAREAASARVHAAIQPPSPPPAETPPPTEPALVGVQPISPSPEIPPAPKVAPTPTAELAPGEGLASQKGALHPPLLYGEVRVGFGATKAQHSKTLVRHTGWTMSGPSGHRVRNIAPGRVVYAGALRGYGLAVVVEHRGEYHSVYAHLRTLLVKVGAEVKPGEPLGVLGATGTMGGERLYFELRHEGRPLDPEGWFAPPGRFR
jgi:murein DD-endopeptidase MepM/ murein hydrolase activator NlpD